MKITSFFIYIMLIITNLISAATSQNWVCNDSPFNEKFLSSYLELLEVDEHTDLEKLPMSDERLMIIVKDNGDLSINSVGKKGTKKLNNQIVKKMSPSLIKDLKKRRYDWDHVDITNAAFEGIVDTLRSRLDKLNVYPYENNKIIRDYSWWIRNLIYFSPVNFTGSIRNKGGSVAGMFIQGWEEIGFGGALARGSRFVIATEPTKLFINLPSTRESIQLGELHPLERATGGGLAFNIYNIGGIVMYQSIEKLKYEDAFDPNNTIYNNWSGSVYWSGAFRKPAPKMEDNSKGWKIGKSLLPEGTQRVQFGVRYSKLVLGVIDTLSNFTMLDEAEFGESFKVDFKWEYLEKKKNGYHRWTGYIQTAGLGLPNSLFATVKYSLSKGFAIGLDLAWHDKIKFLKGEDNEYEWNPGFSIQPALVIRF